MAASTRKRKWSAKIKTESTFPPAGTFTRSSEQIARTMARKDVSPGGIGSAIPMVTMYINRGGKNLGSARKRELERAKRFLQERKSHEKNEGELTMAARKKYGAKSQEKVHRAMHEMKAGRLKSGQSGKKVKSRKQAIAIGLSEARKAGAKVPRKKSPS